jgi:hypothetical protein
MRRIGVLILIAACLVAPLLCAGLLYLRQPRAGLKARLYQVRDGMTRAQAEAIMGRPPDQIREAINGGETLLWDGWDDGPYYRPVVVLDRPNGRVVFRRVWYYDHKQNVVDRHAPFWLLRTSPPACLDGWWPQ